MFGRAFQMHVTVKDENMKTVAPDQLYAYYGWAYNITVNAEHWTQSVVDWKGWPGGLVSGMEASTKDPKESKTADEMKTLVKGAIRPKRP
jgi:hypothetical protein